MSQSVVQPPPYHRESKSEKQTHTRNIYIFTIYLLRYYLCSEKDPSTSHWPLQSLS